MTKGKDMGIDTVQPNTEAWRKRQAVHYHNSLLGHCAMMRAHLRAMKDSETTTEETKELAAIMLHRLDSLQHSLNVRMYPWNPCIRKDVGGGILFVDGEELEPKHSRPYWRRMRMDPDTKMPLCTLPPEGWWCSRPPGHDGPCAARLVTEDVEA